MLAIQGSYIKTKFLHHTCVLCSTLSKLLNDIHVFFILKKNKASALVLKVPLILGVLVQKVSYFPDPDGGQSLRRIKTENPHG